MEHRQRPYHKRQPLTRRRWKSWGLRPLPGHLLPYSIRLLFRRRHLRIARRRRFGHNSMAERLRTLRHLR